MLKVRTEVRNQPYLNGTRMPAMPTNALLDAPIKLPGMTHPHLLFDAFEAPWWPGWNDKGIHRSTEGPHHIGPRKNSAVSANPDGNVLEFNQLVNGGKPMKLYDVDAILQLLQGQAAGVAGEYRAGAVARVEPCKSEQQNSPAFSNG